MYLAISLLVKEYQSIGGDRIETIPESRKYEFLKAETVLIDPTDKRRMEDLSKLFMARPEKGRFLVSSVRNTSIDETGEIIIGFTRSSGDCTVLSLKRSKDTWMTRDIANLEFPEISFIRCIETGLIGKGRRPGIVIGTRPSGHVIVFDDQGLEYTACLLGKDYYGEGITNTRDVIIADADNDGESEILAATAVTSDEKWGENPGSVYMYKRTEDGWESKLIENFDRTSHTRKLAVGDIDGDGENELLMSTVGIYRSDENCIDPLAALYLYRNLGGPTEKELIGELDNAVKSRGMDLGDIDGDGVSELVCGTRSLPCYNESYLLAFKYSLSGKRWLQEQIDVTGERGFHTVCVADIDTDGICEIIASNDDNGTISSYKKHQNAWCRTEILRYPNPIMVSSIHVVPDELVDR